MATAYLEEFDAVVRQCRKVGLTVEHALPTLGVVSGSVAPARLDDLQHVPGVEHVEVALSHELPPPDSPVQ